MSADLKPCPFCGSSELYIVHKVSPVKSAVSSAVECAICGARISEFNTLEEACDVWNTRFTRLSPLDLAKRISLGESHA